MQSLQDIVKHYELDQEAGRLFQGPGQLERVRTQEIITRYLPAPPARILDVGGGPGTYALWLLREGYDLELIDPVALHVEQASASFQAEGSPGSARLGDARNLDVADGQYDCVLLLGPLYHLTERSDRVQALSEARRVLRPGGLLFVAAISRFASLMDGFSRDFVGDPVFVQIMQQDLLDGQHRNQGTTDYFTTAFFHRPEELTSEIEASGLQLETLLGVEGPFWSMGNFNAIWQDAWKQALLLEMLRLVETEPSLLGASAHWLGVARR